MSHTRCHAQDVMLKMSRSGCHAQLVRRSCHAPSGSIFIDEEEAEDEEEDEEGRRRRRTTRIMRRRTRYTPYALPSIIWVNTDVVIKQSRKTH